MRARTSIQAVFLILAAEFGLGSALTHATTSLSEIQVEDIAKSVGLEYSTQTWSADIDDYDNNGFPDILITRHAPVQEYMFFNKEGRFELSLLFRPADRHDCTSADVNADGLVDIYCTVGAERGSGAGKNNLYLQSDLKQGEFIDRAYEYAVQDSLGRGRWTSFLNINGDEFPDLFVGNDPNRSDGTLSPSRIFVNERGKRFTEKTNFGIYATVNPFCLITVDLDGNGLDDLLICDAFNIRFFMNQDGKSFREDIAWGKGISGFRAAMVDLNSDAKLDLVTLSPRKLEVRLNQETDWSEVVYSKTFSNAADVAYGDVNGDGAPDLMVIERGCAPNQEAPFEVFFPRNDVLLLNQWPSFHPIATPTIPHGSGCGRQVLPIDIDLDDETEFLILNGRGNSDGPLQLLRTHYKTGV